MRNEETGFLQIGLWQEKEKIAHGFGTRAQGRGKASRLDWRGQLIREGKYAFPLLSLRQVHGDRIVIYDGDPHGIEKIWQEEGDALITQAPDLALGVFTADCLPIFLYDPLQQAIGIVHVGWRGTAKGLAKMVVEKMETAFLSQSTNILAALGPCIGPCCYEVDSPVKKAFEEGDLPWENISYPHGNGKWLLDLYQASSFLLEAAGVSKENMHFLRICTSCRQDLFYSYRNADKKGGRQLNFIAIRGEELDPHGPQKSS
jgi:YfiH family protein